MHSLGKEDESNKDNDLVLSPAPILQCSKHLDEDNVASVSDDSGDVDLLLDDGRDEDAECSQISKGRAESHHAPLVAANIINNDTQHLLP